MRHVLLIGFILVAACGRDEARDQRSDHASQSPAFEVSESAPSAVRSPGAPSIDITAAPGVAFNYRYAFRLPANRIASVQEQHAQACEKLGVNRCRITGMRYRLVNERDIEAMLAFKLDPAIARHFGKAGVETVVQSEGMLIESEISGVDAGAAIKAADRTRAQLADDLRRVVEQLGRRGLSSEERLRLQSEAEQIRRSIRATQATLDEQQESLATTPVAFHYGSGDLVPGFDARSPMRDAIEQAGNNLIGGLAFLLVVIVSLLPWMVIGWLGWLAVRRWLPRLTRRDQPASAVEEPAPPGA